MFHTRKQRDGEAIDVFVTDLRKLSSICNFGELRDGLIRDRIVCGILDSKLRDTLLRERRLNLNRCFEICNTAELASVRFRQIEAEEGQKVVKKKGYSSGYHKNVSRNQFNS